LTTFVIPSTMW